MIMLESQAGRQSKQRDPKADLVDLEEPDQEVPSILLRPAEFEARFLAELHVARNFLR